MSIGQVADNALPAKDATSLDSNAAESATDVGPLKADGSSLSGPPLSDCGCSVDAHGSGLSAILPAFLAVGVGRRLPAET
jgi:hypothetical protein